jgi:signal transduction histidine kinase
VPESQAEKHGELLATEQHTDGACGGIRMKSLRTPAQVWARGRGFPVIVLAPSLALTVAAAAAGLVGPTSRACGLVLGVAMVTAAVLHCLRWRLTDSGGRLTLVLALTAVSALSLSAWSPHVGPEWTLAGRLALGASLVVATALVGASAAAVHRAVEHEKRVKEELQRRVDAAEGGLREDRARLHEINSTVAGIASAHDLLTTGISADRTDALSAMMRAEVERLQRLVADRVPSRHRSIDLDEVIGQIVLSHLARGRVVLWEPSGLRAMGRADDIAEVVNVLLENAAVHGGPDAVSVQVGRDGDGDGVTVTVSDQGPGIPPELRDRLFDWGVSRPGSPGQGIGLHVAADITHELGGRLELLPTATGATFAVHLPAVPLEVSADDRVARAS